MSVRVRYAPSPTGSPHVGNIRDALFKHLFAAHHHGTHLLRIEDTDRTRFVEGAIEDIFESLHWLGIQWQEGPDKGGAYGPYIQSERQAEGIYDRYIEQLLEAGHAYKAFDTSEELAEMREYQQINKQPIGYFGGVWRDASPEEVAQAEAEGRPFVVRLKIPRDQTIAIEDAIRGRIEWDSNTVDDPVLLKADRMPTYHFAAMVDDHLMEITHIIRGEEWISSAPKHAVLFDAFGWTRPVFVHCPVIKGKDGSKLSKRHGDTRCLDFRAAGILPEALRNFIALIGWSPGGDREILNEAELIEAFDLGGLQPSSGVFDLDKLTWMNGHYLRACTAENLTERLKVFLAHPETARYWEPRDPEKLAALHLLKEGIEKDEAYARQAIELERERVTSLADFGEATAFFFQDEPPFDEKAVEKWLRVDHAGDLIRFLQANLNGAESVSVEACEAMLRGYQEEKGFEKLGPVVHPTRVALTGKTVGPGLFELMSVLGPDRMRARLSRALERTT